MKNKFNTLLNFRIPRNLIFGSTILLVIFSQLSCQTDTNNREQASTQNKEDEISPIPNGISGTKMINSKLKLEDGFRLIDTDRNLILFEFEPQLGEIEFQYFKDSSFILKAKTQLPNEEGKYGTYYPIVLMVKNSSDNYKIFRENAKETFPKMDNEDFNRIVSLFNDLKRDTTITKVEQIDESQELSNDAIDSKQKNLVEKEEKILNYDTQLTVAVLNGCTQCKLIFEKDWIDLLGDNFNGIIAEQHSSNEKLIKEFERRLE
jgi:hypothetical protein